MSKPKDYTEPSIGQQIRFVIGTGESATEYVAFVEHAHDHPEHLIDLTYFTRDSRGAAFAATVPYDATGQKDHSWNFEADGK